MSDLRKAAEMALEVLEYIDWKDQTLWQDETKEALRQALAQPDTDLQESIKKGTKAWAGVDPTKWVEELRGDDTKCKDHPDAPHSFDRNASLTEDRYVCECEYWEPPVAPVNMSQERVDEMAKHKHEPVAWLSLCYTEDGDPLGYTAHEQEVYGSFPVYTTPPHHASDVKKREWVGLSNVDKVNIREMWGRYGRFEECLEAVEAKLKEKNTCRLN
jgi:hypothetical protein